MLRLGYSLSDVLTKERLVVKDHLGNIFNSVSDMLKFYGICTSTYYARIQKGWNLKMALTTPPKKIRNKNKVYVDTNGNKFEYLYEMCYAHNTTPAKYRSRQKAGKSTEESLEDTVLNKVQVTDHKGDRFDSLSELVEHWQTTRSYVYNKLKRV